MLDILNIKKNFCETTTTPWIILLVIAMVFVLGWVIYEGRTVEPEDFTEELSQKVSQGSEILTNFASQPGLKGSFQTTGTVSSGQFLQSDIKRTIASIRPSVVNIKTLKTGGNYSSSAYQANTEYENIGSGIIVSTMGHILTNYHVIANANRIIVSVQGLNRQNYNAHVIDHHVDTDLTLLKIEANEELRPAELGDSDLVEVGDMVLAIGNPFGLEQTVTSGIVSGLRKTLVINGITYHNMIQTDAPINQGSSGGPLTNLNGEIIGINTAIYAPTGVFNGTGFAMPVNRIKRFLSEHQIMPFELVAQNNRQYSPQRGKGWLGAEVQPVDKTTAYHLGLPYIGGVLVNGVFKDSPAHLNGLKRGDVILEFDRCKISDIDMLENLIENIGLGQTARILVYRDRRFSELFIPIGDGAGLFEIR